MDEHPDVSSLRHLGPTMKIEWNTDDFDPEDVKKGKCRELNTVIDYGVFEPVAASEVEPSWKRLKSR